MSISQHIAHAMAESILPIGQCQACERKGLPILPLRKALVPDTRPAYVAPLVGGNRVETLMGLRTLRMGYLYVLLDHRLWHAYEVTEHGHLRRFNPLEPPPGPPAPLAEKCLGENHDIPSSFLTLDTDAHSTAWIAFSSDAWPLSVLETYRQAETLPERFQWLDLAAARANPAETGLAMTLGALQVDQQVFEYAQLQPGAFDSAHGFHSRYLRQTALRGYITNAIARHRLEHGVLALVLDDTLGLVQEYNHQRLNWIAARQRWREDPMRAYQLQTSQILLAIRATHRQWAEQQTPSFEPLTGDGPPVFVDPAIERQRVVEHRTRNSDERLEQRYHEPMRAAFQAEYERQEAEFQHYIDLNAQAYAALCDTPGFIFIERHDYDGDDRESGIAYSKTMARCLAGGVSEAPPKDPDTHVPAPGSSEALWLKWLQDPHSPPYRALLLRDRALLAAWLPSFSATDPTDWNDSEKLYAALNKVIGSDDAGLRLRETLKQAIADTQGALNAASLRLRPLLPASVARAVMRLNCSSQWLYNGVQLIELQVRMKLSEYYALQSAHLRELQHKANAAIAQARDRMHRDIADLQSRTQAGIGKVRPIIQNGLLSLAVLDPKVANLMVPVSIWVEGTADALQERLFSEARAGVDGLGHAAQAGLVDISVAVGTLDANARKLLQGVRVSSAQAAQLVRTSFTGLRGVAGSWELLLALGGLYLMNDSLEKNLQRAEAEIGAKSTEALLALHGARMALLGGGIEALGLIIRASSSQIAAHVPMGGAGAARVQNSIGVGRALIKIGAVVGAVAGIFDTANAGMAAKRTFRNSDRDSYRAYSTALFTSAAGTYFSFLAISTPTLLGPLGVAIVFSMTAYGIIKLAKNSESTPLERWAKRCYFGRANENPRVHWNTPKHSDIAFAELNAATLELTATLDFKTTRADPATSAKIGGLANLETRQHLRYRISFPQFEEKSLAYHWVLAVHRNGDGRAYNYTKGEIVASGRLNTDGSEWTSLKSSTPPRFPDYKKDSLNERTTYQTVNNKPEKLIKFQVLTGSVELIPCIGKHSILAASLSVTLWPDVGIPEAYARISIEQESE
ncbi:T6SS effector BTH_I2691 family protein [Pseudomonas sp. microsymbiont 2]